MSYDVVRSQRIAGLEPIDHDEGRFTQLVVSEAVAEQAAQAAFKSRRTAWIVASILVLVCAAQAAAIAIMLPLKEVVPFTVLVDRQTGYVETVRGVDLGALAEDQAIVESFLAQYVLARETIDPADLQARYEKVALWSIESARTDYVASYQPGGSALADMNGNPAARVLIKRIEILDNNTARVRFETSRGAEAAAVRSDWQAVVAFRFSGAPMRTEDRLVNPLGFQVTAYRRDSETPVEPVAETVSTAAPPADTSVVPAAQVPTPATSAGPDQ